MKRSSEKEFNTFVVTYIIIVHVLFYKHSTLINEYFFNTAQVMQHEQSIDFEHSRIDH